VLKFDASIDNIVVARLRLDVEITAAAREPDRNGVLSEAANTAFASYASEDRLRVLDRLSEIRRSGVDVFLDCLCLHPGEQWKRVLESEIVQRDLFLLFWSRHAKRSQWVTWEWQTALRLKGLLGIEPHPLEPVFEAEPPEELKALHFGDPYMLARKAYERSDIETRARHAEQTDREEGHSYPVDSAVVVRCKKCQRRLAPSWKACPYCAREQMLRSVLDR
jgi:TIR domain